MKSEATEAIIASAASKSTYATGAASTVIGFLGSNTFAVIFGIIVTGATFMVNWYYKRKADRRAVELDQLRKEYIRRGRRTDTDLSPLDGLGEDD